MEHHIGHQAYYQNLRNHVDKTHNDEVGWALITYTNDQSGWNRLPLPPNLRGTLIGRDQVRGSVKQNKADVLFFNTQVPAALLGGRLFRQPYVISTDITPIQYDQMGELYDHRPDKFPLLKRYKHRTNQKVFQHASYLLPWSSWAAESLVKDYGVSPEKIEVISPGVDLAMWGPVSKEAVISPVRILFVGGDLARKGGLDLLAVFQSLPQGSAELILVTRSEVPDIQGVTVYKNLEPNSKELINLYQSSDIFVLPTKGEAFGIAAVEASAAGLPVIATPVGGLMDIVVEGESGLLVPPGDQTALAQALRELIENQDKRCRFGQSARQRAKRLFDARRNSNRIMEILARVNENANR
jgi:glycosyltransferase involved in cell wall biosynthesis